MTNLNTAMPGSGEREFLLGQELRAKILTTGPETGGRHDLIEAAQPAGQQTPLHMHTRYEERFYVVSGSFTVWAGPEKVILNPGDYYAIPMNVPHALAAGPDGGRALTISSPAGFAELLARAATPASLAVPDQEIDLDLFMAVAAELGDVVLGPPGATPSDLPS